MNDYSDIIDLEHYEPKYHVRASMDKRAAQFAPFSALTGYEDAVIETGRITDRKIELSEEVKFNLDEKINYLEENKDNQIMITITYFVKDEKKSGGKYIQISEVVKRIDNVNRFIKLNNNEIIKFDDIYNIVLE